jgi:hypothetical protein
MAPGPIPQNREHSKNHCSYCVAGIWPFRTVKIASSGLEKLQTISGGGKEAKRMTTMRLLSWRL